MKRGQLAETPAQWASFIKKYKTEMAQPAANQCLELLAKLSHSSAFSVGCYCETEARCHRSVLRSLLIEKGAMVEP